MVAFGNVNAGLAAAGGRAVPGAAAGAEVARRIVGAGAIVGAPGARICTVGAGVGGRGAPPGMVAVGEPTGIGGRTGATIGIVADGTAGGASEALKVTRTVSFLSNTLEVCLEGAGELGSFSLMQLKGFSFAKTKLSRFPSALSNSQSVILRKKTLGCGDLASWVGFGSIFGALAGAS
jgi:hypothetical protein